VKVVINTCFGGYSLSPEATLRCYELGLRTEGFATLVDEQWPMPKPGDRTSEFDRDGKYGHAASLAQWRAYLADPANNRSLFLTVFSPDEKYVLYARPNDRTDPILVRVVEEMGEKADGDCAQLKVVEIPDGIEWEIDEYDGTERIAESHRTWG
jgi:hypothetical protein